MKQLMLVMNEDQIPKLGTLFSSLGIEFLELQGMNIEGKDYQILITPTATKNTGDEVIKEQPYVKTA